MRAGVGGGRGLDQSRGEPPRVQKAGERGERMGGDPKGRGGGGGRAGHLDVAVGIDQDVGRLQVPVDHTSRVHVLQPVQDLVDDPPPV